MIHITEVTTKAQLRQFVNFPIDLYRDVPQYIPGTYSDDLADWDREKNPAFSYCEARCWLASRDDGTLVGRIGAILSRKSNDKWGTHRLRFTQVDFIDDREVSAALFQTVEDWARQLGCTEIHGPLGFTDMDREGMLVEGFDRTSCFFTYYNHPYYIDHLTALGYVKDVDWTENLISVPTDQRIIQRWEKIAAYVLKRQHLHIHQVRSRLEYPPLIRKVFELVNVAYAPLYGTVELSDDQIRKYAGKFAPLVKPELTCFVMDENDDLVAFGVLPACIGAGLYKASMIFDPPQDPCLVARVPYPVYVGIFVIYVLAALIRLAYFNVQAEAGCAAGEKVQKVYYGLPVTSSALIFPTFLLLRHLICADIAIGYYAVMLLTALAFVCKFRMRKPTLRTVLIMVGIGGLEFLLILLVKYNGFRAF